MLILRRISKLFSETKKRKRDPLPEKFKINPEFIGKFEKNTMRVIYSDQYNDDMKELGELVKKDVRNLIKDIKKGYLYEDGPHGGDTHYLKDYSDPKKYHRMSKSVNTFDRVVYTIYPPILDAENKRLITPITINNAKNHKLPGQKEYSETNMRIFRQKNYSWDEIKRATKTIGGSAAVGATGGMILTGRKLEKTSGKLDKKGMLIRPIIGAGVGALIGAGIYRAGHKERLKAKQIKDKFETEYGTSIENYISKNIDINQIKKVCEEIEKLNNSFGKAVRKSKFDYLLFYSDVLFLRLLDYSTDDSMIYSEYGPDNIPIVDFTCIYFEDIIYDEYIMYNIKSKKFTVSGSSVKSKPDTLKNNLLFALEFLFDFMEEDVKENYDGEDEFDDMQEGFEFWKKEYYEKAKNIIKQVRI